MRRFLGLPVLILALTLTAIVAVTLLENHADSSRKAQLQVGSMRLALTELVAAPFATDPSAPSSLTRARVLSEIRTDEGVLTRGLASTSGLRASSASLAAGASAMARIKSTVAAVYAITARPVGLTDVRRIHILLTSLAAHTRQLSSVLQRIDRSDARRAGEARFEAEAGTAFAMLTLVGVFMVFYVRSIRTRRENESLLAASRTEASTDALTGLGNRRALIENLTEAVSLDEREPELLLAIFDLNGFKQFNDTFGHGAGDALLARLGERLVAATASEGSAYRMGGDEFCLLARCTPQAAERMLAAAVAALSDHGDGWCINCSYGAVWSPSEASTASDALLIADQRMYADKATVFSARRWPTDVKPGLPREQDGHFDEPAGHFSEALAEPQREAQRIRPATQIAQRRHNRDGQSAQHSWPAHRP